MIRKLALVSLLLLTGCELEKEEKVIPPSTSSSSTTTSSVPRRFTQEEWNKLREEQMGDDSLFRRCEVLEEESAECDDYDEGYDG